MSGRKCEEKSESESDREAGLSHFTVSCERERESDRQKERKKEEERDGERENVKANNSEGRLEEWTKAERRSRRRGSSK